VKLFPVPRTGLYVELLLRDEHCPPHIHVENEEVPWEARFSFCFVSNNVRLMDVDPMGNAPSRRVIDRIMGAITANLPLCREAWWNNFHDCCLSNRWLRKDAKDVVTLLTKRERGAAQIHRAHFIPSSNIVRLSLRDGAAVEILCGTGETQ
jgi:hypothetical protein